MIRLLYIYLLLVLCACPPAASGAATQVLWDKATRLYDGKQYDSAVLYYEQLAGSKVSNAALFYNMGNAYYKLNRIGPAVLNYERALFLEPGNKMAADNLLLTQSRITNRIQQAEDIFFIQWWHSLTRGDRADLWAILALVTAILLSGLLLLRRVGKLPLQLPVQTYFILTVLLLTQLLVAYLAAGHKAYSGKAVVMADNTPFNTAPGISKGQSLIPEGTTVTIDQADKNLLQVTLPDGRSGWMKREAVIFVQPD